MGNSLSVGLSSADVRAVHPTSRRQWTRNTRLKTSFQEKQPFNVQAFLDSAGAARKFVEYGSNVALFIQGDPSTSVLYILKGDVKLSVVNEVGKEAIVAILGPGDFLGEECLEGHPQRTRAAVTITRSTILAIEKFEMVRLLHTEPGLADRFIKHLLSRNIRVEGDLIDQLLNSSEKRLARALLLLAHYGEQGPPQKRLSNISQEMLAEMIGTTRPRVNSFMNKFRKLGFIEYHGNLRDLQINKSLLSIAL